MLDFDKNGKFTKSDFKNFFNFCLKASENSKLSEEQNWQNEIEAQCTLCLWKQVSTNTGKKAFIV
jgi:hypothetical protein